MIEKVRKNAGLTSQYSAAITQLDKGRILRFRLLRDGAPLSWSDVAHRWQNDQSFRCFFISALRDAPFRAYFWETPPVTRATIDREFAFVLVDSPQLHGIRTDQQAFANHFASAQTGASVIELSNLGGDASRTTIRLLADCRIHASGARRAATSAVDISRRDSRATARYTACLAQHIRPWRLLDAYQVRLRTQVLHPSTLPEATLNRQRGVFAGESRHSVYTLGTARKFSGDMT